MHTRLLALVLASLFVWAPALADDTPTIKALLRDLVPGYQPASAERP